MTFDARRARAFHEAGHAVVAALLGEPVIHVTIRPGAHSEGGVLTLDLTAFAKLPEMQRELGFSADQERFVLWNLRKRHAVVLLAGLASEWLHYPSDQPAAADTGTRPHLAEVMLREGFEAAAKVLRKGACTEEEIVRGWGAFPDLEKLEKLLPSVSRPGESEEACRTRLRRAAQRLLRKSHVVCRVQAVAAALLERESLTPDELASIIKAAGRVVPFTA